MDMAAQFEREMRAQQKRMKYLLGRGNPFQQAMQLWIAIATRVAIIAALVVIGWFIFTLLGASNAVASLLAISIAAAFQVFLFFYANRSVGGFEKPTLMAARSASVFALGVLAAIAVIQLIDLFGRT
jgi:predicted membrane-bound mannosyltransferase